MALSKKFACTVSMLNLLLSLQGCGGAGETLEQEVQDNISDADSTDNLSSDETANDSSQDSSTTNQNDNTTSQTGTTSSASVQILQETQSFSRAESNVKIDTESHIHMATYNERLLIAWRASEPNQSLSYGIVSDYAVTSDGLVLQAEYDFGKQCDFVGGITASRDGSPIAVLCQLTSSTFHSMTEAHNSSTTERAAGLESLFPAANYYNLLSVTGAQGFYSGDIFTATADGKDVFVLEFVNGLSNTPDNIVFVNSASRAGTGGSLKYGHLNIDYKINTSSPDLYNISFKTVSNRDSNNILHTDTKEIGLERVVDNTTGNTMYKRRRITDNYGTGLGVTHPDIAEVAYNATLSRWGRLASGDSKTSFATIPDYLSRNKGNQNSVDNLYEEYRLTDITYREPLDIISLANAGFMGIARHSDDSTLLAKLLPGTIGDYSNQDWISLGYVDTGYAKITHFSTDADQGSVHLVGWSPESGVFKVQVIDSDMMLLGNSTDLEGAACWDKGNWAFMNETGCVYTSCATSAENLQLTAICN